MNQRPKTQTRCPNGVYHLPAGMQAATAAVLLVALIVSFAGLRVRLNSFTMYDDPLYIEARAAARGLTSGGISFAFKSVETLYWHPLAWLSHELDFELYGHRPAGHHLTSVVLHAATAALFCFLLLRIGFPGFIAAASALLWALHPLRVESYAWIAERKDVLCALFFTATIAAYIRYIHAPSRRRYALWTCCGALALMSKPAAVSLPVMLLLLDYWPGRPKASLRTMILEKLPLVAMSGVVAALAVIGQTRSEVSGTGYSTSKRSERIRTLS